MTVGINAHECDAGSEPLVLEVEQGTEIVRPNPPPHTAGAIYRLNGATALRDGRVFLVGMETPTGGSDFATLGYRYDPVTVQWESFKPLDPDSTEDFTNQLWDVAEAPNGRIYAAGRAHYYTDLHYHIGLIESFDGTAWEYHDLPQGFRNGIHSMLWGIAIRSDGQAPRTS